MTAEFQFDTDYPATFTLAYAPLTKDQTLVTGDNDLLLITPNDHLIGVAVLLWRGRHLVTERHQPLDPSFGCPPQH